MDTKIRSSVDLKYFGERVNIEKQFNIANEDERYVCQVSCKGNVYILKGFKIHLEYLSPGDKKSPNPFMTNLILCKGSRFFNPHIATPLFMDFMINLAENETSYSYMYIEIIFEYIQDYS